MTERHPVETYIQALEARGLLTESNADETLLHTAIDCLSYDTRTLSGHALFVCKGAHFRTQYLVDAIAGGAVAYISEQRYPEVSAPYILVNDIRLAMVCLAEVHFHHAPDKVTSVGITGTKGKSTTAYYVKSILDTYFSAFGGKPCAIISSIDTYDGVILEESHLTTPEAIPLHQHFDHAYRSGISHLVMEVSSQALKYDRVTGICFDVACFTNIGEDHISPVEHTDFADYFSSKLKLFDNCKTACINTDADYAGEALAYVRQRCEEGKCRDVITFGSHEDDTVYCANIRKEEDKLFFWVRTPLFTREFCLTMPGIFNVSNALAAIAISLSLGIPEQSIADGLLCARASGRMEVFSSEDKHIVAIVDYAHNKMSFSALFQSVEVEYPGREIVMIFGCPGCKAQIRRRDLGELAGRHADFVYIAEEDSGEEPFSAIADEIAEHVRAQNCPYTIIEDRGECIRRAILEREGDRVILITGKGEETRLKRGTEYMPATSDVEYVRRFLAEYNSRVTALS